MRTKIYTIVCPDESPPIPPGFALACYEIWRNGDTYEKHAPAKLSLAAFSWAEAGHLGYQLVAVAKRDLPDDTTDILYSLWIESETGWADWRNLQTGKIIAPVAALG